MKNQCKIYYHPTILYSTTTRKEGSGFKRDDSNDESKKLSPMPALKEAQTSSEEAVASFLCDERGLPIISCPDELRKRGVCKVRIPENVDIEYWAKELAQVTPMIMGFEGDGEYAFYRNILEDPEFPFDSILFYKKRPKNTREGDDRENLSTEKPNLGLSEIGSAMVLHFPILSVSEGLSDDNDGLRLEKELRLDDAFCVHYNMDQDDTTGKKHIDPSDITVNLCLQKSHDTKGSHVLFHGKKLLKKKPDLCKKPNESTSATILAEEPMGSDSLQETEARDDRFLVLQEPGYATIHFGDHPHETTELLNGSRTNVILTYVYTDSSRSDVATRTCYR